METVQPELERLRSKASEKIRDFLMNEIRQLKKPNKNVNYQQKNQLLKFKNFNAFVIQHHPPTANEIYTNYVNIMASYYLQSFERYVSSVAKLQVSIK